MASIKNCEGHQTQALLTGQKYMPQRYSEVKFYITSSKPPLLFPLFVRIVPIMKYIGFYILPYSMPRE
ncbi:hypothetical protein BDR06DRAFT_960147 [Suillus hirtellus]|nr:hypothetical protein BDR06DRAFT_960147 [Suillus hirtellus]